MRRLSTIIRWIQLLCWCALWIWSAFADDQSQPWRIMFSISCMVHVWDRAFTTKSPKEGVNGEKGGEVGCLTEKVIKGLECCSQMSGYACKKCPYASGCKDMYAGIPHLTSDALALLKEQEAKPPHYTHLEYLVNGKVVRVNHPECSRCFETGLDLWSAEIEKGQAYCKRCGQKVKWDES